MLLYVVCVFLLCLMISDNLLDVYEMVILYIFFQLGGERTVFAYHVLLNY